jgi:hypothetical protein
LSTGVSKARSDKPLQAISSDDGDGRHGAPERAGVARRDADWIGARLRRIYDGVRAEPLPDRLADLLRQIDSRTPAEARPGKRAKKERR